MFKDKMVFNAMLLHLRGKTKEFSNGKSNFGFIYEVDNHTVTIKKYKGRRRMTCDCSNCSRFVNECSICQYKIAGLLEFIKLSNESKKETFTM
jgi:hypothetical protein